jgi:hypothetical protein
VTENGGCFADTADRRPPTAARRRAQHRDQTPPIDGQIVILCAG